MNTGFKILMLVLMSFALFFGFLHLFIPGGTVYDFERLHIFLFNLCSGGTILYYYTENREKPTKKNILFTLLSLSFAVFAFLKIYIPAMLIALVLAALVESVRISKFSIFPIGFFKPAVPVSEKFHQASLLCLSIGLVISCMVILNNEFFKVISLSNQTLNTFFLGFSFPISLITMAVMFSFIREEIGRLYEFLKVLGFWTINLGVVIFFIFILFEKLAFQLVITLILFMAVVMIFYMFYRFGSGNQQKNFLTSGMFFLLITAITGILYIFFEFSPEYSRDKLKFLLKLHAFASLYGWNLSGLAVICRNRDFPIKLNSRGIILAHWVTVMILAPLGYYFLPLAVCALIGYTIILYFILFSKGSGNKSSANF